MQPEIVATTQCIVGEAPLWHPDEQKLYWVDIPEGKMFRYDPDIDDFEQCYTGEPVAGFTIQADGALLLFASSGAILSWRKGDLRTIVGAATGGRRTFNDVIADPMGRVFAGAKAGGDRSGQILRIETDGAIHVVLDGLEEPNGFGFSLDRRFLYATDTTRLERYRFDYNPGTGEISNQQVAIHNAEDLGMPDGMTVDSEGFIWSAQWNGGCVIRYSPSGDEERRIDLPVKKASSVTFGGQYYTDLYISTSMGDDWTDTSPDAGALFRVDVGIRGVPEFWSRVGL